MNKTIVFFFISIFIQVFAFSNTMFQDEAESSGLNRMIGYWEGDFIPGNDFTLILSFNDQDGDINGRVYLFQGDYQIQDDPLSRITLNNDSLFFMIEVKNTQFYGRLGADDQLLSGQFIFPDRLVNPAILNRVSKPSKGDFSEIHMMALGSEILEKTYSVDKLKYDLNFLEEKMRTHPQLYLYTSKEEFDIMFDEAASSITSEMTEDGFFRMIAPIIAKINCSHTGIRFSDNFNYALNQQKYLIPLYVKFIDDKAYVINNFSANPDVKKGMQLLSVNGISSTEIKEKLLNSVPTDAINPEASIYEINTNFAFVYSLYIGNDVTFDVEFFGQDGNTMTTELTAMNMQEYDETLVNAYPDLMPSGPIPIQIEIDKSKSTAMLRVFAFWAPDPHLYIDFLEKNFKELKEEKIKNLIIDVRGNQGGYPYYAAELLTYIMDEPFPYFILPTEKGEFDLLYEALEKKEDAFSGNIFVLIDGGCLSTSGHFLSLVKYHNLATLVGETSGATFYCNDNSMQEKLPYTGINLKLAQTTFQTAVSGFDKGEVLQPDYEVAPTLEDLLDKKDAVLKYTYQLIED